jgi:acyl-CoA reductase-like NAD-dependent aldehyde dehydrogenase
VLELGGKSASIIFDDADLDLAVFMSTLGMFVLSGQTCAAGTRLLVHRSIYNDVTRRICEATKTISIGDPQDPMTMMGPLISKEHRERVAGYVRLGKEEGATCALEFPVPEPLAAAGAFMGPVVFKDVKPHMRIWKEEIFGPVLCIAPFADEAEAIALANDTEYGLAAAVWSSDGGRAHRVASRLTAGTVWVNQYGMLPLSAPFGGMKASGYGREGGREALLEYTRVKNVYMSLGGV